MGQSRTSPTFLAVVDDADDAGGASASDVFSRDNFSADTNDNRLSVCFSFGKTGLRCHGISDGILPDANSRMFFPDNNSSMLGHLEPLLMYLLLVSFDWRHRSLLHLGARGLLADGGSNFKEPFIEDDRLVNDRRSHSC